MSHAQLLMVGPGKLMVGHRPESGYATGLGRPVRATVTLYPIGRSVRATVTLYPIRRPVRATVTLYPIGRPVRATVTLYPIGRPVRTTITLYPIGRPVRATITLYRMGELFELLLYVINVHNNYIIKKFKVISIFAVLFIL